MKIMLKAVSLTIILFSLLFVTGCSQYGNPNTQRDTNFLGIVKSSPKSFNLARPTSANVSTDDLVGRKNFSGDEISFLWGLIKIQDY